MTEQDGPRQYPATHQENKGENLSEREQFINRMRDVTKMSQEEIEKLADEQDFSDES